MGNTLLLMYFHRPGIGLASVVEKLWVGNAGYNFSRKIFLILNSSN